MCAFIDAEHALDVAYARGIGVDTERLLVSQPDTGEQALEITETLVRSGAIDLVVVDSVAALTPKAEIEGEMGDQHMGLQARLMSQALRKLTSVTHRTGTVIVFINQLRQKIGVTFGNPETTTGGNALKFYASMRLDVRRIGQVKIGDEIVGGRTRVKIAKNKVAPPFTRGRVRDPLRHRGGHLGRAARFRASRAGSSRRTATTTRSAGRRSETGASARATRSPGARRRSSSSGRRSSRPARSNQGGAPKRRPDARG